MLCEVTVNVVEDMIYKDRSFSMPNTQNDSFWIFGVELGRRSGPVY